MVEVILFLWLTMTVKTWRCPLANGVVLELTGREVVPADDPHPYELVFDMEALSWGYRIAGTAVYMRKHAYDFAVYAKGASVRIVPENSAETAWRLAREAEAS